MASGRYGLIWARTSVLSTRLADLFAGRTELVFTFGGAGRQQLVLKAGTPGTIEARRKGQRTGEYLEWGASQYAESDRELILADLAPYVAKIEVRNTANGTEQFGLEFTSLDQLVGWMNGFENGDRRRYMLYLPTHMYAGLEAYAEGKRTSMNAVLLEAIEHLLVP